MAPTSRRLVHGLMSRAFGEDGDHPAAPATLLSVEGAHMAIRYLDGVEATVLVCQPEQLGEVLRRADLCRHRGAPLLLVNTHYGVLGIATGPPEPPPVLEVLVVSRMENGSVVELPNNGTQPSWQVLGLERR